METKLRFLCGKCKKEVKTKTSTDFMAFIFEGEPMYCVNKECEAFGYLTMAAIKEESTPTK